MGSVLSENGKTWSFSVSEYGFFSWLGCAYYLHIGVCVSFLLLYMCISLCLHVYISICLYVYHSVCLYVRELSVGRES